METHLQFEHRLGTVERVERNPFLLERSRGSTVLHLGCADEHQVNLKLANKAHLHAQLASVAKDLWGVDVSKQAISELRQAGFANLVAGDVERLDEIDTLRGQHFDVIVAGELIEHLYNPGLFLKGCRTLCGPDTQLILTTPNALCYTETLFALLNREAIHPDHTLMWSPAALTKLVTGSGFAIKEFLVYGSGPCVNFTRRESIARNLARLMLRSVDVGIRQILRFRPWLNNGLIVVAQRSENPSTTALRLQ